MADIPLNFIANQTVLQKSIEQSVGNIQRILASSNKLSLNLNVNHAESFRPLGRITGDLKDFERSMAAANVRVIAFAASTAAFVCVVSSWRVATFVAVSMVESLRAFSVSLILFATRLNCRSNLLSGLVVKRSLICSPFSL